MPSRDSYSSFNVPLIATIMRVYRAYTSEEVYSLVADALVDTTLEDFREASKSLMIATDSVDLCYMAAAPLGDGATIVLSALFMYKFRNITHYFLDPGVAEFCISAVRKPDPAFADKIARYPAIAAPKRHAENPYGIDQQLWVVKDVGSDLPCGGFAIHFPKKERDKSIIVLPHCCAVAAHIASASAWTQMLFATTDGSRTTWVGYPDKCSFDAWTPTEEDRLVFGLSLYMDAFPGTVRPAADHGIERLKKVAGDPIAIAANSDVQHYGRRSMTSPHWRRSHFRVLSSEWFKKKRGETILVSGSLVHGRAFDVLGDDGLVP